MRLNFLNILHIIDNNNNNCYLRSAGSEWNLLSYNLLGDMGIY